MEHTKGPDLCKSQQGNNKIGNTEGKGVFFPLTNFKCILWLWCSIIADTYPLLPIKSHYRQHVAQCEELIFLLFRSIFYHIENNSLEHPRRKWAINFFRDKLFLIKLINFGCSSMTSEGYITSLFFVALRPNAGHGLLILEVSRSHSTTHHIR